MWRSTVKIVVAISFLLLLTVPVSFYASSWRGALWETGSVVLVFALTAWGRRSLLHFLNIDSESTGLNTRILTGIAVTSVFLLSGEAKDLLRNKWSDTILSVFRIAVLFGLLRPQSVNAWLFLRPSFWKHPAIRRWAVFMVAVSIGLVFLDWPTLGWWALIGVPVIFLGYDVGELIGSSVRRWVLALKDVWDIARRMGPPIGGFALGYLIIAFIFAGLFASVWRADSRAFTGLPEHPALIDFAYYSVMTISTTGYGDVAPHSPPAKILASAEALIGLGWTIVVFAAVLTVVQRRLQPQQGVDDDCHRL